MMPDPACYRQSLEDSYEELPAAANTVEEAA